MGKPERHSKLIPLLISYGAWKAMYWVKQRGVLRSVNPFQDFIVKDRQYVESIIREAKYLK
jgi:hypothetical protein